MDSRSLEKASQAIGTWVSRRQLFKGVAVLLAGKSASQETAAQEGVAQDPTIEPGSEFPAQPPPPVETPWPTDPPIQAPTDPAQWPTETPAQPTQWPTETPTQPTQWPTETPTETPTLEPTQTPAETPTQPPAEVVVEAPPPPIDDTRRQIADICRAAANVLAEDIAEPEAFIDHPHPEAAYGFLQTLNGIALWGTNAETWDDGLLANYVVCGENIGHAVRIGADAYYEVMQQRVARGEITVADPDTCIFEELAKWRDCISGCAPDDAVCRLTCFWNFTVLNSCRRCLRGF